MRKLRFAKVLSVVLGAWVLILLTKSTPFPAEEQSDSKTFVVGSRIDFSPIVDPDFPPETAKRQMAESEAFLLEWYDKRDKIYTEIAITLNERRAIENAKIELESRLYAIGQAMNKASESEARELLKTLQLTYIGFDEDVEKIVGAERYKILQNARSDMTEEIHRRSEPRAHSDDVFLSLEGAW